MMAMTLLILKNIQYDDQGEEKSTSNQLTEIDCILRQLKSIMKQQQQQKGTKTPRRTVTQINKISQMSQEILVKLFCTMQRIKKYASTLIVQIIRPFCNSSRNLAQAMQIDKNQIKLFKENVCEQHMVFSLIQSVDFIQDIVSQHLQLIGVCLEDELSKEA